MAHPMDLTLVELVAKVQSGELTPLESVEAAFARIRERNPVVNAFTEVCEERALREAREQTRRAKQGLALPPLAGVPLGVKDLEDAQGLVTTYGAVPFKDSTPAEQDSVQVARLRKAGAIVVGKTNVPIFGSTILTKNRVFGVTVNPWDPALTPGGSSGGSSAAIAARMVSLVTAADGGGSIRAPAAFTGTFGLKPTRGLVPMTEARALGMDRFVHCVCFGPLTRCVEDAALVLDVVAGYHPDDPFSVPRPLGSFRETCLRRPERPLRILFSPDFGFVSHVDESILRGCREAVNTLARAGGHVVVEDSDKCRLPDPEMRWAVAMGLQEKAMVFPNLSEDGLAKLDKGVRMTWEALDLGADEFGEIFRYVRSLNDAIEAVFGEFDLIASPAMPIAPFAANGPVPIEAFDNPLHVVGFLTVFNFSGHPAAAVPLAPHGQLGALQLVAPRHQDALLLAACREYEAAAGPFQSWPPPISKARAASSL